MEIAAQTSIMVDVEVFDDHGCEVVNGSGSLTLNKAQYVSSGCDSIVSRAGCRRPEFRGLPFFPTPVHREGSLRD